MHVHSGRHITFTNTYMQSIEYHTAKPIYYGYIFTAQ